jgi:hypothetical protein
MLKDTTSTMVCIFYGDVPSPVVNSLVDVLQTGVESAVFQERFEIDEQEPASRLEALSEQLMRSIDLPQHHIGDVVAVIDEIVDRVRLTIPGKSYRGKG